MTGWEVVAAAAAVAFAGALVMAVALGKAASRGDRILEQRRRDREAFYDIVRASIVEGIHERGEWNDWRPDDTGGG